MAKIPAYPNLAAPDGTELLHVVDPNDTTDDPVGSSKHLTTQSIAGLYVPPAVPAVSLSQSIGQAIANNTGTPLSFDGHLFSQGGLAYDGGNPTRITVAQAGIYAVTAGWGYDGAVVTTVNNQIGFRVYDDLDVEQASLGVTVHYDAGYESSNTAAREVFLQANWYLVAVAYQNTGASRNTLTGRTFLSAVKVG